MSHIAFINNQLEYYSPISGGALATAINGVIPHIEGLGHTTTVYSFCDSNRRYRNGGFVSLGFQHRLIRAVMYRLPRVFVRLSEADEAYEKKVVTALRGSPHAYRRIIVLNDFSLAYGIAKAFPQSKIVAWTHNVISPPPNPPVNVSVAACSRYVLATVVDAGFPAERASVAPNGVAESYITPKLVQADRRPTSLRVVCLGRLDPNKGHHLALDAVVRAQARGLDIDVSLVGARWWYGTRKPDLYQRQLEAMLKVTGGRFLGCVASDEVPDVLAEADVVFALSLVPEPFGLVVLEAMAAGCLVIAADLGGLPEAVGGGGILVNPHDSRRIDQVIDAVTNSPHELMTWKRRGLAHAAATPWTVAANVLLDDGSPNDERLDVR